VLLVTAIELHFAVIYICWQAGRRQEYVCVACYCNCNTLRCDVDLLLVWKAAEFVSVSCYCNCNALRCDIDCCRSGRR